MDDDGDSETPNVARMYDYYLGGSHNFAVDRAVADAVAAAHPAIPPAARANRSFLRRAVRYLVAEGVDRFLDLGSGIPTVGNVHEIAQAANPAARVAYVDIEPVAVAYSTFLLRGDDRTLTVQADLCRPAELLARRELTAFLGLGAEPAPPIAVLLVSVLHWIPDTSDPDRVVACYRQAMPPGSYLVISHGCTDELADSDAAEVEGAKRVLRSVNSPITPRPRSRIAAMFDGLDLVEPGLVQIQRWRPDAGEMEETSRLSFLAAIGRKP